MKDTQISFESIYNVEEWRNEWQDMPEFSQEDVEPFRSIEVLLKPYFDEKGYHHRDKTIKVHFRNLDDIREFRELVRVKGITHETKIFSINHISNIISFILLCSSRKNSTTGKT